MRSVLVGAILHLAAGAAAQAAAPAASASTATPIAAPKPLFRDPVHDGAADVSIVYDRARRLWTMFYTNRRADLKLPDEKDVSWVHGTAIGIATSRDGLQWQYQGVADIPASCTGPTLWAPDLYYENGTYHMTLSVVEGIYARWNDPRERTKVVHLTSQDLGSWHCAETYDLGTPRVIDTGLLKLDDGTYRIWFKDLARSRIYSADSRDLKTWVRAEAPAYDGRGEGPKIFRFQGWYWMIIDAWRGMTVLRSDDATHWTAQPDRILETPGSAPTDTEKGQHADVVVNNGRAYIYYFVHQSAEPQAKADPAWGQRTVIQVAELKYAGGRLLVDRNATVSTPLQPPAE
jgi:beta-xylosidase